MQSRGIKYAVVFLSLGLLCAFQTFAASSLAAKLLWIWCAVACSAVGLAYGGIGPRTFLKRSDGRLHPASYLLFWPFHLLNSLSLFLFRVAGRENPLDEVVPGLYLGCRLNSHDRVRIRELRLSGVLDLTCEFNECKELRTCGTYRCIPVLDTQPPTVEQIEDACRWMEERLRRGPLYVHCAMGHGRSATFVAAYLLHNHQAATAEEAVSQVAAKRPKVGLSSGQMEVLRRWADTRRENTPRERASTLPDSARVMN